MMNELVPSSECSSGCESGWTLYLEHSTSNFSAGHKTTSFGENQMQKMGTFVEDHNKDGLFDEIEDEEKDLSMVSDASSGPPHIVHDIGEEEEEEEFCYNNNGGRLKKRGMKSNAYETQCCNKVEDLGVDEYDDTASSHVFTSKKIEGIRAQNNEGPSFKRLIDYSSQGYSATHVQVVLESRKRTR